ncbi:unnamed protein product [Linum trigynum]|uniref:Reverse transcriptase domain-containing protein n=1 Tax=Linum trigynum TaxID=586398 RepID=A0AAV2CJX4_9ROSI
MAVEFFDNLFTSENQVEDLDARVVALPIERLVTTKMNQALVAPVTPDEIRHTVFSIEPTQAPGSDGFTANLFLSFWDIVGPLVVEAVGSFFVNGKLLRSVNHTWITLIPKVEKVETMRQLRPISLCQVIYKIISKILANRLALVLPTVVSPEHNAFIKERQIVDNVLIGHEIMHYLKIKTKGYMALKVDMEKAYDRVEWPFLLSLLKRLGFGAQWVQWIHECISPSSFSIMMNGMPAGYFRPSRGLRQGDPLSPLLFVLCTEGLTALIKKAVLERRLTGVRVSPRAPRVSNLFFADDSYMLVQASMQQCENLLQVLGEYEELSGQRVNLDNSAVCFSRNVLHEDCVAMAARLGVGELGVQDKYIGLPTLISRPKSETFRFLEEKLLQKLQGWKQRHLSWAAKETLLKSVAAALPVYVMACFKLPVTLCRRLDKYIAHFWWGGSIDRVHWMSWRKLCRSKQEGGLGFRRFEQFNQALLAKVGWRIIQDPNSLLARIYKGKYFPN